MDATLGDLLKAVAAGSTGVITGLAVWGMTRLSGYLTAEVEDRRLQSARVQLDHAVTAAVRAVEQSKTTRASDGSLSADAALKARTAAVEAAKLNLGAAGFKTLTEVIGLSPAELEEVISNRVEAAVYELKTGAPPIPTGPVTATSPSTPAKPAS